MIVRPPLKVTCHPDSEFVDGGGELNGSAAL
jgi:hypothetical protein